MPCGHRTIKKTKWSWHTGVHNSSSETYKVKKKYKPSNKYLFTGKKNYCKYKALSSPTAGTFTRSHFAFKHDPPFLPVSHFAAPPEPDPAHPTPNDEPARRRGRPAHGPVIRDPDHGHPRVPDAHLLPAPPVPSSSSSFLRPLPSRLCPPRL